MSCDCWVLNTGYSRALALLVGVIVSVMTWHLTRPCLDEYTYFSLQEAESDHEDASITDDDDDQETCHCC